MKDARRWLLMGSLALACMAAAAMAQDPVDAAVPPAVPAEAAIATVPAEAPPALAADVELSRPEAAAHKAALAWLELVDARQYAKTYAEAARVIRTTFDQDKWVRSISAALPPLGAMQSRVLVKTEYLTGMPGGEPGPYVQLRFASSYENKAEAQETVTMYFERGAWRVAGYFLK
jgi:hypothetical protein